MPKQATYGASTPAGADRVRPALPRSECPCHAKNRSVSLNAGTPAGAEKAGYKAMMVSVDSPRTGNREADERSSLALREDLEYSNLVDLAKAVQTHDQNKSSASAPAQLFK